MVRPEIDLIPSLWVIFFLWVITVWVLINSFSAISLLLFPSMISLITSISLVDRLLLSSSVNLFVLEIRDLILSENCSSFSSKLKVVENSFVCPLFWMLYPTIEMFFALIESVRC